MTEIPSRSAEGAFAPAPTLQAAMHSGGAAAWAWEPDGMTVTLDDLAMDWWGADGHESTAEALIGRMDPRDRAEAERRWTEAARTGAPFEHDFRVNGRWIAARGHAPQPGEPYTAIFLDITDLRSALETQELVLREMGHRIGNLFAVASSVTALAAKGAGDTQALVRDLRQRFAQLSGAFRAVQRGHGATEAGAVMRSLVSPYDMDGRIAADVTGPPLTEDEITTLGLVVHELITNALKYGALATAEGRVTIEGAAEDGRMRLVWREHGGPVMDAPPSGEGLGRRLIDTAMTSRSGGSADWRTDGGALSVHLAFDARDR